MKVRTQLTRYKEAAVTERPALDALLDEILVAHVGFVSDGHPVVLPTAIARDGDSVLIHGSTGSPWMQTLARGVPASVAVTALEGLVIARSAFASSVNYRSAVLFGEFRVVADDPKESALIRLTDALLPGRSAEVRRSRPRERAATMLLTMPISQWSMKVADDWPEDDDDDIAGPAWAGVIPIRQAYLPPKPAPDLGTNREVPPSVRALGESSLI